MDEADDVEVRKAEALCRIEKTLETLDDLRRDFLPHVDRQLQEDADRIRKATAPRAKLLVLTCGLSAEPLQLSALVTRPDRILLAHSDTKEGRDAAGHVETWLKRHAGQGGLPRWNVDPVELRQIDPVSVYRELVAKIRELMQQHRIDSDDVAIDITGGKKTTVAAAFLAASELGVRTLYIDGDYDPRIRAPRPGTAEIRLLKDPAAAFGLRQLHQAQKLREHLRFTAAAELLDHVAESVRATEGLQDHVAEVEKAAVCARALGAWDEGSYPRARDLLKDVEIPVPSTLGKLAADWDSVLQVNRDRPNRLEQYSKGGDPLLRLAADQMAWGVRRFRIAMRNIEGPGEASSGLRDAFLRVYATCEVIEEGLFLWLLQAKRLAFKGSSKNDFEKAAGGGKNTRAILLDGVARGDVKVSDFQGIGDVYGTVFRREVTVHRNALLHKVESPDVELLKGWLGPGEQHCRTLLVRAAEILQIEAGSKIIELAFDDAQHAALSPPLPG